MQINSIRLQNVRRFVEPVEIAGIGPGLNVLSAPNEAGKSTFFDALHAAFFAGHRSWDKALRGLQPKAGGDPRATVCFEADGAAWKLRKQWSSSAARKEAKLWRDGVLVGQGEEAEEVLARVIGTSSDGGPAGLLWVQQGRVELETGGEEQKARLGIMESVAGEVEAMTGGQRMKAAMRACDEFLGRHLTGKGKPKKGGELADITQEAEALAARRAALEAEVVALQDDLAARRRVRAELDELQDAAAGAERERRLHEAEAKLKDAQDHAGRVELAARRVSELEAKAEGLAGRGAALAAALKERDDAREAAEQAAREAREAGAARDTAQGERDRAHAAQAEAQTALDAATARVRRAMQIEAAAGARARRAELAQRVERAEALRRREETLQAETAGYLSDGALRRIEEAEGAVALAERHRAASAPAFVVSYSEGSEGRVLRDGVAVPGDTAQPVPDGAELEMRGIGRLRITPGAAASDTTVDAARQALNRAIEAAGVETAAAARASVRARRAAEDELRSIRADLNALAPDGIPALRAQLATLPEPVEPDPSAPSREDAEAAERAARETRDAAGEALAGAEATLAAARDRAAQAEAALDAARDRVDRADAVLGDEDDPQARLDETGRELEAVAADLERARAALEAERAAAPDLEAAETAATRARQVAENARARLSRLREDLAGLNARIATSSSGAPEEQLALTLEQLEQAETRKAALEFEVAVNRRLRDALAEAQSTARNAYVEPVHRELAPLLRMLWPDADPVIDAETGMITSISRRSVEEEFDILSGGTREQISLMVRLAFARILAGRGSPAPVILDDAIVYTDDERIEQMFNALTSRARDLQIIVLSCRQRAFRSLGGELLQIEPAGEDL